MTKKRNKKRKRKFESKPLKNNEIPYSKKIHIGILRKIIFMLCGSLLAGYLIYDLAEYTPRNRKKDSIDFSCAKDNDAYFENKESIFGKDHKIV